jgi:cation transport protein ChaC
MVYRETTLGARFLDNPGGAATALTYTVDRKHSQYAGKLDLERQLAFIRQGIGQSGTSPDYVASTVAHLREMGIRDERLEAIAQSLKLPRQNPQAVAAR